MYCRHVAGAFQRGPAGADEQALTARTIVVSLFRVGTVGLVLDSAFERHLTGPDHPERPARLTAIRDALQKAGLIERCTLIPLRRATDAEIERVHTREYIERLIRACRDGQPYIDVPDSAICPESYEIALRAAGTVIEAVDRVLNGDLERAFCAVRPPGHHAERDRSMGFCLLGNVAIAVEHARRMHRIERVAVVDWDVHHGNGTQHVFESDPDVLFISLHGHPYFVYPGTGFEHEVGRGAGVGATLNITMMPGAGDAEYHRAFEQQVIPRLTEFAPQFLLISCGFDAHRLDPLAPICLETGSFAWMTRAVVHVAQRHCSGRLVSVLEGGYHLEALGDSAAAHVRVLLESD
jgi:acetoin utilization deacetylase AcuC-like enzyme